MSSDRETVVLTKVHLRIATFTGLIALVVWPTAFYFTTNYAIASLQASTAEMRVVQGQLAERLVVIDRDGTSAGRRQEVAAKDLLEQSKQTITKLSLIVEGQEARLRLMENAVASMGTDIAWMRQTQEQKQRAQ